MRDGKSWLQWIQGVGAGAGRLLFGRGGCRLAFTPVEFVAGTGVAPRLAFTFPGRLAFEFRFPFAFALSFEFFGGVGFFLGLFSLVFADELLLLLFAAEFVFAFAAVLAFAFAFAGGVLSPLVEPRLISTATVCPTFTISPACGS